MWAAHAHAENHYEPDLDGLEHAALLGERWWTLAELASSAEPFVLPGWPACCPRCWPTAHRHAPSTSATR